MRRLWPEKKARITELKELLAKIPLPSWVEQVQLSDYGFCTHYTDRPYHIHVRLKDKEQNMYRTGTFWPMSNHAFPWPKTDDEFRAQLTAAMTMACAHEIIEHTTNAGNHWCDPHKFKGGCDEDTEQWVGLDDAVLRVVTDYGKKMAV